MTSTIPFANFTSSSVIVKVKDGIRPDRPSETTAFGISDLLWDLVQSCWAQQPDTRPDIHTITEQLKDSEYESSDSGSYEFPTTPLVYVNGD